MAIKRFIVDFECENDVFYDDLHNAIADALLSVSKMVRQDALLHGLVSDNNGNVIGQYDLTGER